MRARTRAFVLPLAAVSAVALVAAGCGGGGGGSNTTTTQKAVTRPRSSATSASFNDKGSTRTSSRA